MYNTKVKKSLGSNQTFSISNENVHLPSSIRISPEQKETFLKLYPILFQIRIAISKILGIDATEDLSGSVIPQVVLYPSTRPDKYALAHPATFDEREIVDHIETFTNPGEKVLDCMSGSATTLIACYKTGRVGVGIELMDHWYDLSKLRISETTGSSYEYGSNNIFLHKGDCIDILPKMKSEIIDFGIFSPPYFDILSNPKGKRAQYRQRLGLPVNYGNSPKDLGHIHDYNEFMNQMKIIYAEYLRILKPGKYLVSIVSDIFKNGRFIPYHLDTILLAQSVGFVLRDIQVVMDHWKQKNIYGNSNKFFPNFHHHYALVFKK